MLSYILAERVLHENECVLSVIESWDAKETTNFLQLRRRTVESLATLKTQPIGGGKCAGVLHTKLRPNKWSKRWMELKLQAIYYKDRKVPETQLLTHPLRADIRR